MGGRGWCARAEKRSGGLGAPSSVPGCVKICVCGLCLWASVSPVCRDGSHPTLQVHGKILRQSATSCKGRGAGFQEPGCLQWVCLSLLSFGFPAAEQRGCAVQGGKRLGVHDRKWRRQRTLLCLGHAWAWEPVCSHGIVPPTCIMASFCVRMKIRCLTWLPSSLQKGPPSPAPWDTNNSRSLHIACAGPHNGTSGCPSSASPEPPTNQERCPT